MKALLALLLSSCAAAAAEPVRITRATFAAVEKAFDQTLQRPIESPFYVLGGTRGIYVGGFGAVLTAEINLVLGPTVSPFRPEMTKQEIAALKQRKLERVPYLKEIMRKMLVSFATALDSLPQDEQIVLGVSLFNFRWEDSAGLPTQILMQATRKALLTARADSDRAFIKVQEY